MFIKHISPVLRGYGKLAISLTTLLGAVVLATFGGVVGIILGLSGAAANALQMPLVLSLQIVVIAFLFPAAVGIIFGYFPARQAARLDPIEALRHE